MVRTDSLSIDTHRLCDVLNHLEYTELSLTDKIAIRGIRERPKPYKDTSEYVQRIIDKLRVRQEGGYGAYEA